MNDKELLELAAKAAGMDRAGLFYNERMNCLWDGEQLWFEPLTDDGDALRLAMRLDLDIAFKDPHGKSVSIYSEKGWMQQLYDDDEEKQSATRRAIVRAAAEIGRGMG